MFVFEGTLRMPFFVAAGTFSVICCYSLLFSPEADMSASNFYYSSIASISSSSCQAANSAVDSRIPSGVSTIYPCKYLCPNMVYHCFKSFKLLSNSQFLSTIASSDVPYSLIYSSLSMRGALSTGGELSSRWKFYLLAGSNLLPSALLRLSFFVIQTLITRSKPGLITSAGFFS